MHRKLTTLSLTAIFVFTLPTNSYSAALETSGYVDINYMLHDGTFPSPSPLENKFGVAAEADLKASLSEKVFTRLDLDFNLADNTGLGFENSGTTLSDSGKIEQGYLAWESPQAIMVKAGVFNNPLSWEAEDAPQLYQITHGQLYNLWDGQTALYGDNIAGISITGGAGPITATGAVLNDLGNVSEKHSFMALAKFKPTGEAAQGVEFQGGFVTQDQDAETIVDLNGTFQRALLTFGGELMFASKFIDYALGLTGNFKFNEQFNATVRFDNVNYEASGIKDSRSYTFAANYLLDRNLIAKAEVRINTSDFQPGANTGGYDCKFSACDGSQVQFAFLATF